MNHSSEQTRSRTEELFSPNNWIIQRKSKSALKLVPLMIEDVEINVTNTKNLFLLEQENSLS